MSPHCLCAQSRHKSDIDRLKKERLELQDKLNGLQNQIYKGNEKMDQFKLLMNWNQEELEQWALAARQKVRAPHLPPEAPLVQPRPPLSFPPLYRPCILRIPAQETTKEGHR